MKPRRSPQNERSVDGLCDNSDNSQTEELRQKLLAELYAGAGAGLGAMLLDEQRVRRGGQEELERIARQHGIE